MNLKFIAHNYDSGLGGRVASQPHFRHNGECDSVNVIFVRSHARSSFAVDVVTGSAMNVDREKPGDRLARFFN